MEDFTEQLTGSALPVSALFDWLKGKPHEAIGWQADLSTLQDGALIARRTTPLPAVTLRLKLDL
jgi:outer membrane lipoprotein LolB